MQRVPSRPQCSTPLSPHPPHPTPRTLGTRAPIGKKGWPAVTFISSRPREPPPPLEISAKPLRVSNVMTGTAAVAPGPLLLGLDSASRGVRVTPPIVLVAPENSGSSEDLADHFGWRERESTCNAAAGMRRVGTMRDEGSLSPVEDTTSGS